MHSTSHLAMLWHHDSPQTFDQAPMTQGRLLAVILTAGVVYDNISEASGAVSGGSAGPGRRAEAFRQPGDQRRHGPVPLLQSLQERVSIERRHRQAQG